MGTRINLNPPPWTDSELSDALRWRADGVSSAEIGIRLGRSEASVQARIDRHRYEEKHGKGMRTSRATRTTRLLSSSLADEREYRTALANSRYDVTANFFNDPLPGYSALDQRSLISEPSRPRTNITLSANAASFKIADET